MPDEYPTVPMNPVSPPRTGRRIVIGLLMLMLIGAGLAAWLVWRGSIDLAALTGERAAAPAAKLAGPAPAYVPPAQTAAAPAIAAPAVPPLATAQTGPVETRLALLEDRLARLDLRAEAASGNAARAEGLLIAFAARRTIDRGAPLGYLEDQLGLRFADAQPNAVKTIVDGAADPVTLDTLLTQLDTLGTALTNASGNEDAWSRVKHELSALFVIRREEVPSIGPQDRLSRAKLMLAAGKVTEAIAEIHHLPGAAGAQDWIARAQRYDSVQRALDLIETTAMLDPHRLQDSAGRKVDQPSPLAPPPASAEPTF